MQLIWVSREQKYFCKRDWTGQIRLNRFNKFTISRNGGVLPSSLVCPEADRCAGLRRKRHRTGSVRLVATPSEAAAGATLSVAVFAHYQGAVGPQASQALIGSKQRNGPSAAGAGPSLGSVMC